MITLQFVSDDSIASDLIAWYTRSIYTHVDIVRPDGWLLGARANGGVKVRSPTYRTFKRKKRFVTTLSTEQETKFWNAATAQIGKPYDWTGIVAFIADRNWRHPDHWFCSELVAWCFEQAGVPLLRVAGADKVTPRDLTTSLLLFPL